MTTTDYRPVSEPLLPPEGRKRRRIALYLILVVVLAVFATWLVAFSPVFGVGSVEVHGEHTVRGATIEQAAKIEYGQPVVRVDTAAITERVEALPQIESAQVSTSFPSTVVITVVERTPVGYVTIAGRPMLVDRTGKRYLGVDKAPNLPRLVVSGGGAQQATFGAVATVAAAMPADLRARTKSIDALDPDAITLVLDAPGNGDLLVRWGSAARSRDKARVVDVLSQRKKPRADQIDVTDPDRPFTN